ncbi:MAG: DoxX family protein [Bryobacterales bacterium]|nr:DoxX family protein [Bryobacterales bacterium]
MLKSLEPRALSVLRIIAGFTFSLHGHQKLLGAFGGLGGQGGTAAFGTQMWLAGVLECVGGLLILLGLFTRPVAILLAGQMAVAYFLAHAPRSFWPILSGGELAALYCFLFLYFSIAGPGSISLDRLIWKKK